MHKRGKCVIAQSDQIEPKHIGSAVVDSEGNRVGKVIDIFGSVNKPYVKIIMKKGKGNIIGKDMFLR